MATQETVWKPISMLEEGTYEVSNTGLVRRTACQIKTQSGVILNMPEKVVQPDSKDQYPMYRLVDTKGVRREFSAAELVARTFLDNNDNKLVIKHKDGNPYNVCVDNLEWCYANEPKKQEAVTSACPKSWNASPVVCVETGKSYTSKAQCIKDTGIPKKRLDKIINTSESWNGLTFKKA